MPFFSIQLNSNRPAKITEFFDNIEATADRPEDIEILLHIDKGDTAMEEVAAFEKPRRRFDLRVLQTDLVQGYTTLWKPLNPLFHMTHPDVYFVSNLFDEIRFETKGWDSLLRRYQSYHADDIFRLRCSQFRFRNYTDFWQCGFAPDSSAFYTRRWLELGGDWNPCMGPDSFQQCVAFYMQTYDPFGQRPFYRDIAVPDVAFSGEGTGIGTTDEEREKRRREDTRLWFILMSHGMQEEAKRRAMRLNSHIIAAMLEGTKEECELIHNARKKRYSLRRKTDDRIVENLYYRLSRIRIALINIRRGAQINYYLGRGSFAKDDAFLLGARMILSAYFPGSIRGFQWLDRLSSPRVTLTALKNRVYRSRLLRKCFWFLRAPYRLLLKWRGL